MWSARAEISAARRTKPLIIAMAMLKAGSLANGLGGDEFLGFFILHYMTSKDCKGNIVRIAIPHSFVKSRTIGDIDLDSSPRQAPHSASTVQVPAIRTGRWLKNRQPL